MSNHFAIRTSERGNRYGKLTIGKGDDYRAAKRWATDLAEEHGCRIYLDNSKNGGSTTYIEPRNVVEDAGAPPDVEYDNADVVF